MWRLGNAKSGQCNFVSKIRLKIVHKFKRTIPFSCVKQKRYPLDQQFFWPLNTGLSHSAYELLWQNNSSSLSEWVFIVIYSQLYITTIEWITTPCYIVGYFTNSTTASIMLYGTSLIINTKLFFHIWIVAMEVKTRE